MYCTIAPSPAPCTQALPVTSEQVHKRVEAARLLTDWHQHGDDDYLIRARWPENHSFYAPQHGLHDPLLLAESVRQCVPLLSHAVHATPFGHRQSWSHFSYTVDPAALAVDDTARTDVELHVACRNIVRRPQRLASMNLQVAVVRDGVQVGTARTRFINHAPALYQRLRGPYADLEAATAHALPLAPPITPAQAARESFIDTVLSPTNSPRRSQLRVDLNHPVLFDHPVDHAPGMLLLEAARQSAHAAVHPAPAYPVAMDIVFARYTELDAPCWIHTSLLPSERAEEERVLITAIQRDVCVFSGITTMRRLPLG